MGQFSVETCAPPGSTLSANQQRKLLETGDFATIEEIANAENINPSYVSRVLRMTLLAPEIVEAILAGKQPPELTMARALKPFACEWAFQRSFIGES